MNQYLKLSTFHLYSLRLYSSLFSKGAQWKELFSFFLSSIAPILPHTDTRKNFIIAKVDSQVYFLPVNLLAVVYTHFLILSERVMEVSKLIKIKNTLLSTFHFYRSSWWNFFFCFYLTLFFSSMALILIDTRKNLIFAKADPYVQS